MHRLLLLALVLVVGCGGTAEPPRTTPAPVEIPTPAAPGEIVVAGEASPASHGPYRFAGEYAVTFEQRAPEDPGLDFTGQTAFVADLNAEAEIPGPGSVELFEAAEGKGERTLTLDGSFFVDVSFGDFPYVIRFTPHQAAS